jgi:hypothetical protein
MKNLKTAIIATIVTALLICSCAYALPAHAEDIRGLSAIVVSCGDAEDPALYVVDCLAEDGNIWSFYSDVDEWEAGDLLILYMADDEVVDVLWTGFLESDEMETFLWMMKW